MKIIYRLRSNTNEDEGVASAWSKPRVCRHSCLQSQVLLGLGHCYCHM